MNPVAASFSDIRICAFETGGQVEQFMRFAWRVYEKNPCWVPPIIQETKKFLSGKGHFFDHTRYRLFMAEDSDGIAAVVAAYYDSNLSGHWGNKIGLLGYFEALPDKDRAVEMLLKAAEDYLRDQGAKVVWGPVNGNIANPSGLLSNAYNRMPVFLMSYNPSYYHAYFRQRGYGEFKELIAFTMDLMDGRLGRKIERILSLAEKKSPVTIRSFNKKKFREESDHLARIYSGTFKYHWGYVPQSEEEVFEILDPLRMALDPDLVLFAEHEGKTIGFVLTVPDYNPLIRKLNGDLGIPNAFSFLREKKRIREARLIAIGVVPEWRGQNVAPLLCASVYSTLIKKGFTTCEYSWVLGENLSSQNVAKQFYSAAYKSYTIYQKPL